MSLIWTPPKKSLICQDWRTEEEFYEWSELQQPLRTSQGIAFGVVIGLVFWALVAVSVFVGRRMGL